MRASKRKCRTSWRARDAQDGAVGPGGFLARTNQTRRMTRRHACSDDASQRSAASRATRSTHLHRTLPRRRSTRRTRWRSWTTKRSLRIWTGTRNWSWSLVAMGSANEVKRMTEARNAMKTRTTSRGRTKTSRWPNRRGRKLVLGRGWEGGRYPRRRCVRHCKRLRAARGFVFHSYSFGFFC